MRPTQAEIGNSHLFISFSNTCEGDKAVWHTNAVKQLIKVFYDKPYLSWYLKEKESLSEKSLLEHILNYGNWDDYLLAEQILGIQKTKSLFTALKTNPAGKFTQQNYKLF